MTKRDTSFHKKNELTGKVEEKRQVTTGESEGSESFG